MNDSAEKRHWVRLTKFCNQRCVFCLDRFAQTGGVVEPRLVRKDLERGRKAGMRRVVLSGGEPTVHPDFLALVALARALGYERVQTITNGRRFCYPGFLEKARTAGLGEITFSLHGNTPLLHDRLTRVPGSFVQCVAGLRKALASRGLIVSVDVCVNRLNLPVLREHLEFCAGLGVREFDLLALVPFGDAWRNLAELQVDYSGPEQLAHLHRALELGRGPDLRIWTNRLKPEYLEGFEELIQPPEKLLDELRGRRRAFARYVNGGRPPGCLGQMCGDCYLKEFCADLAALLKEGSLPARRGPLCRENAAAAESFRFGPRPDIFAFGEFYIRARAFAKGSACRSCALASACDGMSVRRLKADGFASLKPAGGS